MNTTTMPNKLNTPIGILGGTFDPIHLGHLHVALELLERLLLPQVRFIPCDQPVHKKFLQASTNDRANMIEIAIADYPRLALDLTEIERQGFSYTIDTLLSLREQLPNTPLCLILGLDAFRDINTWKSWQTLLHHCHFIVVNRPQPLFSLNVDIQKLLMDHHTEDVASITSQLSGYILFQEVAPNPISATEIRSRIRNHQPIEQLLPTGVWDYIQRHQLYLE
jgi:nicotinate-nucleotide adenylyltransferase